MNVPRRETKHLNNNKYLINLINLSCTGVLSRYDPIIPQGERTSRLEPAAIGVNTSSWSSPGPESTKPVIETL